MSTTYLLGCMLHKFLRRKRTLVLVFLGMMAAALGFLIVASVARNRELQTPWYAQRAAKVTFEQPISPTEIYDVLHTEYVAGNLNGYAFIADADTSGGISLGGQEGALWYPVTSDDQSYSTHENIFWIHQQAVPEKYFHNLEGLTANIDGIELQCAGLTYYGLNWDWNGEKNANSVSFLIDGKPAQVESPILEKVYVLDEWLYIAPVIVGAEWIAVNNIPIIGVCITLANPNDETTLLRITSDLSADFTMETDWNTGRVGTLTANEWLYLGALILAMLNVASLYYGLIDGFDADFFIFRKIGARKSTICKATLLFVTLLSICAFAGACFVYEMLLFAQEEHEWLAILSVKYVAALFFAYVWLCLLLTLGYTGRLLKSFRKKGSNL